MADIFFAEKTMSAVETDIAVVGSGLIGSVAAHAVGVLTDRDMMHIAPKPRSDERTTALLSDAVDLLERLGVWPHIRAEAAPLRTIRLIDGSQRLLRARPLDFSAREIGREEFGYNIRNDTLLAALSRTAADRRDASVVAAKRRGGRWHLELCDGSTVAADVVVAADGRNSVLREVAGIGARRWSYDQTALVTTFAHTQSHRGVSAEFHTESGPFTQVPLPGMAEQPHRSSLVWVVRPQDVSDLERFSLPELSQAVGDKLQHMFGTVEVERPLASFPLTGLIADTFGRDGVLLVGEAGHVFPPIGAQGANLGFRDIAAVLESVRIDDPVDASIDYARRRRADVGLRTTAVDALNRSLLTGFLPVQAARTLGMGLLGASAPLRRKLMELGLGSSRAA